MDTKENTVWCVRVALSNARRLEEWVRAPDAATAGRVAARVMGIIYANYAHRLEIGHVGSPATVGRLPGPEILNEEDKLASTGDGSLCRAQRTVPCAERETHGNL